MALSNIQVKKIGFLCWMLVYEQCLLVWEAVLNCKYCNEVFCNFVCLFFFAVVFCCFVGGIWWSQLTSSVRNKWRSTRNYSTSKCRNSSSGINSENNIYINDNHCCWTNWLSSSSSHIVGGICIFDTVHTLLWHYDFFFFFFYQNAIFRTWAAFHPFC